MTEINEDTLTAKISEIVERSLKRALSTELDEKVNKKIKINEIPQFKRQYNKWQYEHNNKVKEALEEAKDALKEGNYDLSKNKLEEGIKIIDKRQKLVKIADREEDGWEVVKCYISDNLASDSVDEKRLNRSRRQASNNKKRSEEKRSRI